MEIDSINQLKRLVRESLLIMGDDQLSEVKITGGFVKFSLNLHSLHDLSSFLEQNIY